MTNVVMSLMQFPLYGALFGLSKNYKGLVILVILIHAIFLITSLNMFF